MNVLALAQGILKTEVLQRVGVTMEVARILDKFFGIFPFFAEKRDGFPNTVMVLCL